MIFNNYAFKSISDKEKLAYEKGYKQALEDNNILYGKEADDFLKKMKETESKPITKKERKEFEKMEKNMKKLNRKKGGRSYAY